MTEDPPKKPKSLAWLGIVAVLAVVITVALMFLKSDPSTIQMEVAGPNGQQFFGWVEIDGKEQAVYGVIPQAFIYKPVLESFSYTIVPLEHVLADGFQEGLVVTISENEKVRGSASGIYGAKGLFKLASGLAVSNAGLTAEDRTAQLERRGLKKDTAD